MIHPNSPTSTTFLSHLFHLFSPIFYTLFHLLTSPIHSTIYSPAHNSQFIPHLELGNFFQRKEVPEPVLLVALAYQVHGFVGRQHQSSARGPRQNRHLGGVPKKEVCIVFYYHISEQRGRGGAKRNG